MPRIYFLPVLVDDSTWGSLATVLCRIDRASPVMPVYIGVYWVCIPVIIRESARKRIVVFVPEVQSFIRAAFFSMTDREEVLIFGLALHPGCDRE